jgi:glycosyltransferase involved in cell wall biosynthesis
LTEEQSLQIIQRYLLSSKQFILYPAQFWPHKNHLAVLLALRKLVDQGHTFKLVLTGSDKGTLHSINQYVEDLNLQNSVIHAGFVNRHELASLYSHCFALVYPSFFGPDNLPPLEAMSYRTPALVADVPGALEQYGEAVLRFDPRQPDQIVACINRLYSEPDLRNILINHGLRLVSNLTPSAYVDRVIDYLVSESLPLLSSSLLVC